MEPSNVETEYRGLHHKNQVARLCCYLIGQNLKNCNLVNSIFKSSGPPANVLRNCPTTSAKGAQMVKRLGTPTI